MAKSNDELVTVLEITIHEASDLKNVVLWPFNQDPYVLIRSVPSGAEAKTSQVPLFVFYLLARVAVSRIFFFHMMLCRIKVWGGGTKPQWDPKKHNSRIVLKVSASDSALRFEVKIYLSHGRKLIYGS